MNHGAWWATVHGVTRVRWDWATNTFTFFTSPGWPSEGGGLGLSSTDDQFYDAAWVSGPVFSPLSRGCIDLNGHGGPFYSRVLWFEWPISFYGELAEILNVRLRQQWGERGFWAEGLMLFGCPQITPSGFQEMDSSFPWFWKNPFFL